MLLIKHVTKICVGLKMLGVASAHPTNVRSQARPANPTCLELSAHGPQTTSCSFERLLPSLVLGGKTKNKTEGKKKKMEERMGK